MRVLFINENIGGHATVHHHLRAALSQRHDIEPTFVDVPPARGLRRLAGARIPGLARADLDLQPLRAQLSQSLWLHRQVKARLEHVDVVHLYTHNTGLLSQTQWRRRPTVVSLDTTNVQNAYRLPSRRPTRFTPLTVAATKPFERRVYEAASIVVANSEWAARSVTADYGIASSSMRLLPFGIVGPPFGPGAAPGTSSDRPRFVFVGRSLARKGGLRLLEVFRRHFSHRAELVLVTNDRVEPSPNVMVVDDLKPGDERLWQILRQASAFAFPSEIDMAPNAVIEAMTAGLPVIARPVGAIPEMVLDGVNGLLVEEGSASLRQAMERLCDDAGQRIRMGEASRLRAIERYDGRTSTGELIRVFHEAISVHKMRNGRTGDHQ